MAKLNTLQLGNKIYDSFPDKEARQAIENLGTGGAAIIDVLELPEEDINDKAFYRLLSGTLIYNQYDQREYNRRCICVNELPKVGQPVTTDMTDLLVYYSIADNDAYGYITLELGASAGVPEGWYTLAMLAPVFETPWEGIVTDINDDPHDDSFRLLLTKDYYIYQDEWCKLPFACEKAPRFDIQWDGVIGDRFALDLSSIGKDEGLYLVKVSSMVLTAKEIIGAKYTQANNNDYECVIIEEDIDADSFVGTLTIDGGGMAIVYSADDLNAALGVPAGYVTNGIYFVYAENGFYTNRFVAPPRITKIDEKFLPDLELSTVAITGNYYDLFNAPQDIIRYNQGTQTLNDSQKRNVRNSISVYSKNEVDAKIKDWVEYQEVYQMINDAIGSAIGGSY